MNKLTQQAEMVAQALREGKNVLVVLGRMEHQSRVIEGMIPEELKHTRRVDRSRFVFENGATLRFLSITNARSAGRGENITTALMYQYFEPTAIERERAWELSNRLLNQGVDVRPLELDDE